MRPVTITVPDGYIQVSATMAGFIDLKACYDGDSRTTMRSVHCTKVKDLVVYDFDEDMYRLQAGGRSPVVLTHTDAAKLIEFTETVTIMWRRTLQDATPNISTGLYKPVNIETRGLHE